MRLTWGVSVLDWRAHAIDEDRRHPKGVFLAECGHALLTVTVLRDTPRGSTPREQCLAALTPGGTAVPP